MQGQHCCWKSAGEQSSQSKRDFHHLCNSRHLSWQLDQQFIVFLHLKLSWLKKNPLKNLFPSENQLLYPWNQRIWGELSSLVMYNSSTRARNNSLQELCFTILWQWFDFKESNKNNLEILKSDCWVKNYRLNRTSLKTWNVTIFISERDTEEHLHFPSLSHKYKMY